MKAVLCKEFCQPEGLVLEEVPDKVAEPGRAVISIHAAGINFPDGLMIQGKYQNKPPFPFTPGGECAGIVRAVGEGVTHLRPGMRVLAFTGLGGYAEEVAADARMVLEIPAAMSFPEAAGFTMTYATSHHALKDLANLRAGETLLVLGAAGGVGLTAVEIGKALGARVIACASSEAKLAICRAHGADATINYSTEDMRARVKEITEGRGLDVVYDPVGDRYSEPMVRSLAWGGRFLVIGFAAGEIPRIPTNLLLLKEASMHGVFWGNFARANPAKHAANMAELFGWYEQGKLKPHIHGVWPLSQVAAALNEVMQRHALGKVILQPDPA